MESQSRQHIRASHTQKKTKQELLRIMNFSVRQMVCVANCRYVDSFLSPSRWRCDGERRTDLLNCCRATGYISLCEFLCQRAKEFLRYCQMELPERTIKNCLLTIFGQKFLVRRSCNLILRSRTKKYYLFICFGDYAQQWANGACIRLTLNEGVKNKEQIYLRFGSRN